MAPEKRPVPVVPTSKAAGHASNQQAWSKPSSFFKDRRREQTGGVGVAKTGLIKDVQTLRLSDLGTVRLFHDAEKHGYYDDNDLLLERLIQLLHKLPRHSRKGKQLTDAFITKLWSTLDHPHPTPIPAITGRVNRYRMADGSNNNPYLMSLGAAGTPYARAVTPLDIQSPDMPDPGLVFDTLLGRGEVFKPHPCGISSMMFYLGVIITHDIFQTNSRDEGINDASSYLDLAPLYGNNWEEQRAMRQFSNGLLKPDCFAHKRVLTFPPACCVFLIMFNRFHNYAVTQLARINEANRFKKPAGSPSPDDPDIQGAWKKYDEDLFQTGRLITCGLYVNIILKDYVRVILCLNRTDSTWTIDPRTDMDRHGQKSSAPTGVGNQVSVEFNLLYRWHGILSKRDAEWTDEEFRRILDGKDPGTATFHEMITAFRDWEDALPNNPQARNTVSGLQRGTDGTFNDDEMVEILRVAIEDHAGSFGARSVPQCLRPVEMLGVLQARRWGVATLNEFRAFIGLTRHRTFEDINPDPQVAAALKSLYGYPANVELYAGLVCEKTKPPMTPGSGVCVGYTSSRAILSDAVALVRGDRFYTDDYTPKNLTNWGYTEGSSDLDVDSGNVMYKLIFCAFPHHFQNDSIYAHHPLVTPAENKIIFKGLRKESKYSWGLPCRQQQTEPANNTHKHATDLNSSTKQAPANSTLREHQARGLMASSAQELIRKHSYEVHGCGQRSRGVDAVGEVVSLAFTRLTAELFSFTMKSPSDKNKSGYTDAQLCTILSVLCAADSSTLSPGRSYELKNQALDVTEQFMNSVGFTQKLSNTAASLKLSSEKIDGRSIRGWGRTSLLQKDNSGRDVRSLIAEKASWSAMAPVILLSESLSYHLDQGPEHMKELHSVAKARAEESNKILMQHLLNGCLRYRPGPNDANGGQNAREGDEKTGTGILPLDEYFPRGLGSARSSDLGIYAEAMTAVFRELVSLPALRRATGQQGQLIAAPQMRWDGQAGRETSDAQSQSHAIYMTSDRSSFWPVPTTMRVVWDASN